MLEPPLHVRGDRDLGRFEVGAALQRGNQPRTLDLRLPLRAREGMPFPAPLARGGIAKIDDDCPSHGRSLADVALHFCFLLLAFNRTGVTRMGGSALLQSSYGCRLCARSPSWSLSIAMEC
jgi:hypothetical protein